MRAINRVGHLRRHRHVLLCLSGPAGAAAGPAASTSTFSAAGTRAAGAGLGPRFHDVDVFPVQQRAALPERRIQSLLAAKFDIRKALDLTAK